MKSKFIIHFVLGLFLATSISSCLKNEEPEEEVPQTLEEELALLDDYINLLENDGYDVDTTDLGVYYVILEEGEGEFPKDGDNLTLIYTGYYINGLIFDSSEFTVENGTYSYEVGEQQMVAGWEDGIKLINKGAHVLLIVPSGLGYGPYGYQQIPPNNTIIFDIEMVDIEP